MSTDSFILTVFFILMSLDAVATYLLAKRVLELKNKLALKDEIKWDLLAEAEDFTVTKYNDGKYRIRGNYVTSIPGMEIVPVGNVDYKKSLEDAMDEVIKKMENLSVIKKTISGGNKEE